MKSPRDDAWLRAWSRSAARWEALAPRLAAATGWHVWNPGRYGASWHRRFRRMVPLESNPVILFGLNPGPYGMAQTGIPFTDVKRLRERLPRLAASLEIHGPVEVPGLAPPSLRPFLTRSFESSAVRIYRFLDLAWGSAEEGWRKVGVANPCSLLFMDAAGKNRTPADLQGAVSRRRSAGHSAAELREACDRLRRKAALEAMAAVRPRGVVLLGKDVQKALGSVTVKVVGARDVLPWEHPARAVPTRWARGLLGEIRRRGWK